MVSGDFEYIPRIDENETLWYAEDKIIGAFQQMRANLASISVYY
jgi:hypothetical protein